MLKKTIWNRTIEFARILGMSSAISLAGMTAIYYRTHDHQVKKTCLEDRCEYQHPDQETTHILNYLAGKDWTNEYESKNYFYLKPWKEFNPDLYDQLWQIEVEVGAPKIRWNNIKNDDKYHPPLNTIFLSPDSSWATDSLVAEFAHAKQSNDYPISTLCHGYWSKFRTLGRVVGNFDSWEKGYQPEYDLEGSIEYEAHQVIEPMLKERLNKNN